MCGELRLLSITEGGVAENFDLDRFNKKREWKLNCVLGRCSLNNSTIERDTRSSTSQFKECTSAVSTIHRVTAQKQTGGL